MGRRAFDKGKGAAAPGLIDLAGVTDDISLSQTNENAWIEVIRKMDDVYAELVHYQVELEEKNAALEEAQQFIGSVQAAMTDVLVVCDVDGLIQQANTALQQLTGKSEADVVAMPLASLFADDSRKLAEEFAEKTRSDETIVDCEASLIGRDGLPTPLAINCSSRYDRDGRLVGMVIIGRPIGELRKAYQELDLAHRKLGRTQQQLVFAEKMAALGRLVAGVAHELNNPISFVFGNMHALKRYGERITQYLRAIDSGADPKAVRNLRKELKIDRILNDISPLVEGTLEGAERVSEIVQDLRRFSGSQKEPFEPYNLNRVIRTATQWVVKSARDKPDVQFELPKKLEIIGRKGAVHQIIVNMVQNAVDVLSGNPKQRIDISCELTPSQVVIRVADNGPGIAEADLPRVFEPFFTTKPLGEGTGMGLYVSYALAEEQGGKLRAANRLDGGAEFSLSLPLGVESDA